MIYMVLTILVGGESHQFQTNSIIEASLIHHNLDVVLLACLHISADEFFTLLDAVHMDVIPMCSHILLPFGNLSSQLAIISSKSVVATAQAVVELIIIVVQLTLHGVVRCYLGDTVLDNLYPACADTLGIASVIERHNLILKQTIDGGCIQLVLMLLILIGTLVGECPSCTWTIAFIPPSVQNGQIDNTIHERLLTRCTRCFERTCGSVHPDIHAAHQPAGQLHVIILQEDDLTQELGTLAYLIDLLDKTLTCSIGRMSLTCIEELYGIVRIVHYLAQALQVSKEQVSTLISSKSASETDKQGIGIDLIHQRYHT